MFRNAIRSTAVVLAVAVLLSGCGIRRKKYNNPITKDTQQPDKVLFDKAINDIEHSRFEIARLLLQNLINTYDTSEYLAKAKLAIADAWFREGGSHGLAQAEAEYKDFILFYPAMEEAAEAQEKVCDIHYKQMEKPDRDPMHALRAEQECKQLVLQFPNSKFAPLAQQKLRDIHEVLADSEFRVGTLYQKKGSFPAAANRFQAMVDQFPLYSKADEALWQLAESYHRMGDNFEGQQVGAYQRIVKDYPLSIHAEDARAQLSVMKRAVPEADPVAMARMKFELENHTKRSPMSHFWGVFKGSPDVTQAAKSGAPPMEGYRPTIPVSVPASAANPGLGLGSNEVSISNPGSDSEIDKGKEARTGVTSPEAAPATPAAAPATVPATTTPKTPDPNDAVKQTTLTPAQQKKEYQKALKQQQDAINKARNDRKKKEAQQAAAVKEQKKKAREEKEGTGKEGTGKAAGPRPNRADSRARQTMSRILLVDDSPHAQRMGERILSEEGYEVVTVSNADSALIRLDDVDPDLVLADTVMPGRTGYEICQYLKMSPRHKHVRVILTAGVMETLDEAAVARVEADATLRKPFEASALIAAVKPLAELAVQARAELSPASSGGAPRAQAAAAAPFVAVIDEEQVRAAVTVALDASMAIMVDEISRRVTAALATRKSESAPAPAAPPSPIAGPILTPPPSTMPAIAPPPKAAPPVPVSPKLEPVRRVTPVRLRSGSILGLDIDKQNTE